MLLLHTCSFAIFEISNASGQLMEVERTLDYGTLNYGTNVLLLFSRIAPGARPPPSVSSMLQTAGLRMEGYAELSDIDPMIRAFLPQR
jgi:hypothetical protein